MKSNVLSHSYNITIIEHVVLSAGAAEFTDGISKEE